jgi:hypothetical protein
LHLLSLKFWFKGDKSNGSAMWQCYGNSMQRHILMHMAATYFNIPDVEKMPSTTWERALNQTLTAESNVVLKPSCGSLEISTSRREQHQ